MTTLNGGIKPKTHKSISEEEQALIDEHMRTKGVFECAPAEIQGGEMSPVSHEFIMEKRKEFRQKQREKNKSKK